MNQTFNIKRFSLLFVKHTADNYKTYLMSFFVLLGVLFLSMGFVAYVSGSKLNVREQIPFFIFALLIAGSIFTSIIFSDLGDKKKAISALTLPASHFEKYFIAWIYSFIIFQVLFIPAFYLVVIIINQFAHLRPGDQAPQLLNLFSPDDHVYITFLFYSIIHAIALWGAIFFEKHHFIKTAFAFFVGIFTLSFLNTEWMKLLIGSRNVNSAIPFSPLNLQEEQNFARITLPDSTITYVTIMILMVTIILWTCSFYRLKEKEV